MKTEILTRSDANSNLIPHAILTAGNTYLDIDAYACCVAMAELLRLKGMKAIAYSQAPCNYSVCKSLVEEGQITKILPVDVPLNEAGYIIVDVSDPEFLKKSVPFDQVIAIYDHHVGFEEYWTSRIGADAHIEFIGAAATLIYREWIKAGMQNKMKDSTAKLLIAAILDNTLNLTSTNTTSEDIDAYNALCKEAHVEEAFRALYFSEVQSNVEADLKNAIFNDIKTVRNNAVLPSRIAQISVWNADRILAWLPEIRGWFSECADSWMINLIDINHCCSYFICDDVVHQKRIEKVFKVHFESGIAKSSVPYLRKEIIKKTVF